MQNESPRLRLSILGIVALSLFGALFARLWYLQVMAAPTYQVEAQANRVREIVTEAPRGRILDAKGRILVDNRTSLVVTVNPHDLPTGQARDDLLLKLATTLTDFGVPTKVSGIEQRLKDQQFNPLQPIPVAKDVPQELFIALSERAAEFPAVAVSRESVRYYPNGTLAAHILGYVGRISQGEFEERTAQEDTPKPYQPDSDIGKEGVEKTYEDDLRGTPGKTVIEIDAQNRPVRTLSTQEPVPGNDVQLTVDLDTQRLAEQALAEQLASIRGGTTKDGKAKRAPAGAVAMLDPRNGNVLALASYPTYDPSEWVNGISQARYQQFVGGTEAENPLIDRAIQGVYAPGSTFKVITAYAALSRGLITPSSSYNDRGSYQSGNRTFGSPGATGTVDLRAALTKSSDVYFYWLGDRFWQERDSVGDGIQESGQSFGLFSKTGIPLPAERTGFVPTPEYKKELWEALHPGEDDVRQDSRWYPGDNINMAIGQGYVGVTPLQLANVYATLANGGTVYQPNVVARILKPGGDPNDPGSVVRTIEPVVKGQVDLPPEIRQPIVDGLIGVTSAKGGTATSTFEGFNQSSFQVAGKTGTAQVSGKADSSLFAAFAPAGDPQYAVAAVLEESGFGANGAAPLVRRIFEFVSGQAVTAADKIQVGSE